MIWRLVLVFGLLLPVASAEPRSLPSLPDRFRLLWSSPVSMDWPELEGTSPYLFDPRAVVLPGPGKRVLRVVDPYSGRERTRITGVQVEQVQRIGLAGDHLIIEANETEESRLIVGYGLDGRLLWRTSVAFYDVGPVSHFTDHAIVLADENHMGALDPRDGRTIWVIPARPGCRIQVGAAHYSVVALHACPRRGSSLQSLDSWTGHRRWILLLGAPHSDVLPTLSVAPSGATLVALPGGLVVVNSQGRVIVRRTDTATGDATARPCQGCVIGESSGLLIYNHQIYYNSTSDVLPDVPFYATAVDSLTGRERWSVESLAPTVENRISTMSSGVVLSEEGSSLWPLNAAITAIDPTTGDFNRLYLPAGQNASMVIGNAGGVVYIHHRRPNGYLVTAHLPVHGGGVPRTEADPGSWPNACALLPTEPGAVKVPSYGTHEGQRWPRPTSCATTAHTGRPIVVTVQWAAGSAAMATWIYQEQLQFERQRPRNIGQRMPPGLATNIAIIQGQHLETIFDSALILVGPAIVLVSTPNSPNAIRSAAAAVERRLRDNYHCNDPTSTCD
jgi:outer membrane protein assembly factor BamB